MNLTDAKLYGQEGNWDIQIQDCKISSISPTTNDSNKENSMEHNM